MNLLTEPWMPVRTRAGNRRWVSPDQLADADLVAFDADRPDFNGALAQFAIGLLQTTTPADNAIQWRRLFDEPPTTETIGTWIRSSSAAFELQNGGVRFMQDMNLGAKGVAVNDIGALLIECPGENALKNNTDHFVKRNSVGALCPTCAALALFTLQLNAPAGGVGYRTGLRGGGPLTTLVLCEPPRTLWHDLWLNVRDRRAFSNHSGDAALRAPHFTFPWMAPIEALQQDQGQMAPLQVHPAHMFWSMPRRIRLDFDAVSAGDCGLCARSSDQLLTRFSTKNYGLNYKGNWDHPLSPYRLDAKEGWLPLHPQPGGLGYRHWLAWILGVEDPKKAQRSATTVQRAQSLRSLGGRLRLWAFGFDMDNMKARCWYESTMPMYSLADCDGDAHRRVQAEVSALIGAAELAAFFLRSAIKGAWFDTDARGDFSAIDASFWSRTEAPFYAQLQALIQAAHNKIERDEQQVRERWLTTLSGAARYLFDDVFVGCGAVERGHPRRVALAWQQLQRNLAGPKLRAAVGLPELTPSKPRSAKTAKPATTA